MEKKSLNDLIILMSDYKSSIKINHQKLNDYKNIIKEKIIEIIKKDIDTSTNTPRLQKYLEKTKISDLDFLFRSLNNMRGNNEKGTLSTEKLILLNEKTKSIAESYGITTEYQLFELILNHLYYKRTHPLLCEKEIVNAWNRFKTLAYLDEFFKDFNNCLDYQGSYTTYKYVKSYLKEVLIEDSKESDYDLVYKNFNRKIHLATENLVPIANELLTLRESIPNSRISVCNQGLKKTSKKVPRSPITFDQQIFINAIAFGTTKEKLETKNYEDAKRLLYLPHQKITK